MEIHQWIPLDNIKIPIGMTRMDEDVESATLLILSSFGVVPPGQGTAPIQAQSSSPRTASGDVKLRYLADLATARCLCQNTNLSRCWQDD